MDVGRGCTIWGCGRREGGREGEHKASNDEPMCRDDAKKQMRPGTPP